jgi:hypothetical protein
MMLCSGLIELNYTGSSYSTSPCLVTVRTSQSLSHPGPIIPFSALLLLYRVYLRVGLSDISPSWHPSLGVLAGPRRLFSRSWGIKSVKEWD